MSTQFISHIEIEVGSPISQRVPAHSQFHPFTTLDSFQRNCLHVLQLMFDNVKELVLPVLDVPSQSYWLHW